MHQQKYPKDIMQCTQYKMLKIALSCCIIFTIEEIVAEDASKFYFDMTMPGIIVEDSEAYLCSTLYVGNSTLYLTGFTPINNENAHHIAAYLCSEGRYHAYICNFLMLSCNA